MTSPNRTKLIAFDGDHTLWTPIDGICLSDRTPDDAVGWPRFTYRVDPREPLIARREDGVRFELRAEARGVLEELKARGILTGVISFNHQANVRAILEAFDILPLFDYVIGQWHTGKDAMLREMLALARSGGRSVDFAQAMLVDDDPGGLYAVQYKRLGASLVRFGEDIKDLREVLQLIDK